ncbi:MAG: hypothetical protein M1815_006287 [Lichina confinis]|nr:MAG: hypothetical protein M1815_006287 [Lichina confinis]
MNDVLHSYGKEYLLAEKAFDQITVFEQQASTGGVWNYFPDTISGLSKVPQTRSESPVEYLDHAGKPSSLDESFTSPMYDQLETNIPHLLMRYSDQPFPEDAQLFPARDTVLRYLQDYARDPTLAFVALPQRIIPFPFAECQAAIIARVWANRLKLPSLAEMNDWEERIAPVELEGSTCVERSWEDAANLDRSGTLIPHTLKAHGIGLSAKKKNIIFKTSPRSQLKSTEILKPSQDRAR